MVMFRSTMSADCEMMENILLNVIEQYDSKFGIGLFDIDYNTTIPEGCPVEVIPTIVFFKNGEMIDKIEGPVGEAELNRRMHRIIDNK